jgi:opacity protein-like surface antigen
MKKLFLIISLLASFVTTSAFAKTEGLYAGLDIINTDVRFYERFNQNNIGGGFTNDIRVRPSHSDNSVGIGANFKYAVNLNNAFIALGGILERNDTRVSGKGGTIFYDDRSLYIRDRYGIKGDFGYDVTNNIAPYFTFGYARVDYVAKCYTGIAPIGTRLVNGVTGALFYGAGLKFDFFKNISLNLEYTTQNIRAKTKIPHDALNYVGYYKTRIDVAKLGISYKF